MADGTIVIDTSIDKKKIDSQVSSIKANVERGFKNIAKIAGAALATATAAVGAFAVSSVKDFIVFEDKMNEVFTLLPGASTAMKDSMIEDVKALSKEMGVLPTEVIPAVYQALSAGIPQANVFDFVRIASKLATAGVAEMDDAVGVLSTVVNNYASTGLTAEQASNMLFTAVKDGVTTIPELATKLGDVVPIAASLGIGFDEVAGATGAMTAIMGKGSTMKAVTNLRGMLNELGKEGSAADKAFQQVAGVGFTEFIEKGGTLQEAMGVLKTASEANNTSINNLFGSIEAGQAALILAGDGAEKFAGILDDMGNSTGATDGAFRVMSESAKFQIDKIKANIEVLKLNFATQFMPAMNGILTSILGMIDGTEGAVEQFSTLVGGLLSDIIIKAVEFLPKMIAVGANIIINMTKGILEAMPDIVKQLAYMLGYLIGVIYKKLPEFLQKGQEFISNLIKGIVSKIPDILSKYQEIMTTLIQWLAENAPDLIVSGALLVAKLIVGIINALPTIIRAGVSLISGLVNAFISSWPTLKEKGKEAVGKLVEGIKSSIGDISSEAINIGKNLIEGFITGFESIKDKVRDKIMAFFDLIPEGIRKLLGIASPSKVTKEIGGYVAEGFADGIEDGKAGVIRSAEDIATVAVETVEASVPDATVAGTEVATAVATAIATPSIWSSAFETIGSAFTSFLDEMKMKAQDWAGFLKNILNTAFDAMGSGMVAIGEALASGESGWESFGKVALSTLADILKALGYQLLALAVSSFPNFVMMGLAGAGAAAAFIASGYIKSKAASYDVGGIIGQDQVANIHAGETILPRGITADMKSAGLMIQPLGRNGASSGNMYGIINLDGRELARAVFKHTDSNVGLAYTG